MNTSMIKAALKFNDLNKNFKILLISQPDSIAPSLLMKVWSPLFRIFFKT